MTTPRDASAIVVRPVRFTDRFDERAEDLYGHRRDPDAEPGVASVVPVRFGVDVTRFDEHFGSFLDLVDPDGQSIQVHGT